MISPRALVEGTPLVEHGGVVGASDATGNAFVRIDFSTCLNAFGAAPIVREAVANTRFERYPDPHSVGARTAIANRHDRPVSEIVLGAGASELIFAACFAYLSRGDEVVIAGPAFGEYERSARLCGALINHVDLLAPTATGVEKFVSVIQRVRPRMVFVATPNSPAGAQLEIADVRRIAEACATVDALLLLDQSYDAFSERTLGTPALPGHASVLHVRSLTKDHALAGLRLGFAVCNAPTAAALERARTPWAVSTMAQSAAIAAMSDEAQLHAGSTIARLREESQRIATACAKLSLTTVPSSTHYQLVETPDADNARDRLLGTSGLLVRSCTSFGLPRHIRIAARTPDENNLLIDALALLAHEVGVAA